MPATRASGLRGTFGRLIVVPRLALFSQSHDSCPLAIRLSMLIQRGTDRPLGIAAPHLRGLFPGDPALAQQWPLLLDILEDEGSMGFVNASADFFRAWEVAIPAQRHVESFVDAIRVPLLQELRDALTDVGCETTAELYVRAGMPGGRETVQNMIQAHFGIPIGGPCRLWAGMWAWEDLHWEVKTSFPVSGPPAADRAVAELRHAGFRSWQDKVMTRLRPIDEAMLGRPTFQEEIVAWRARGLSYVIAASGVLLPRAGLYRD